jgi:hypothetical protein
MAAHWPLDGRNIKQKIGSFSHQESELRKTNKQILKVIHTESIYKHTGKLGLNESVYPQALYWEDNSDPLVTRKDE